MDEEKIYQVLLTLLVRILQIHKYAQLSIDITFDITSMFLSIRISEEVATMNFDGSKKHLLREDNEKTDCIEFVSASMILQEYGGNLVSKKNQLDINILALSLEEFQRLPRYKKVISTFDSMKDFLPKCGSFVSRIE